MMRGLGIFGVVLLLGGPAQAAVKESHSGPAAALCGCDNTSVGQDAISVGFGP